MKRPPSERRAASEPIPFPAQINGRCKRDTFVPACVILQISLIFTDFLLIYQRKSAQSAGNYICQIMPYLYANI
jgi:hypothetical protein